MYFILNKISLLPQHGYVTCRRYHHVLITTRSTPFWIYFSSISSSFNILISIPNNELYRPIICKCSGYKNAYSAQYPGHFLQTFVVLSHLFHILHQEDNTVMYWSDRTEYAGCFSQAESAVHNRRIPIQSVGFHILFPENYGKIQHSSCSFQAISVLLF